MPRGVRKIKHYAQLSLWPEPVLPMPPITNDVVCLGHNEYHWRNGVWHCKVANIYYPVADESVIMQLTQMWAAQKTLLGEGDAAKLFINQ